MVSKSGSTKHCCTNSVIDPEVGSSPAQSPTCDGSKKRDHTNLITFRNTYDFISTETLPNRRNWSPKRYETEQGSPLNKGRRPQSKTRRNPFCVGNQSGKYGQTVVRVFRSIRQYGGRLPSGTSEAGRICAVFAACAGIGRRTAPRGVNLGGVNLVAIGPGQNSASGDTTGNARATSFFDFQAAACSRICWRAPNISLH
jgi:hypothetical protein